MKTCEINYAIWWCSSHQSTLDDNGLCLHRKRQIRATKRRKSRRVKTAKT